MKLVTLNTWGGAAGASIIDFFKKYSDTDIFLLQEIYHHATDLTAWDETNRRELFEEIKQVLPNHVGYFAPSQSNEFGLAAFAKDSLTVKEEGHVFVYRWQDAMEGGKGDGAGKTLGRNLQFLHITSEDRDITVLNFHGLWNGGGKFDSDDRLEQSKKILDFAQTLPKDFILAGDFNLRPDTQSLLMLEKQLGLRNLVKEYAITSTRTSHYTKPEKFADYVLVSKDIRVNDFKVLPDEVSDHAPLYLEFE